jgi:hypothetical protein
MTNNFDKWIFPSVTFAPDSAIYGAGDSIGGALSFDIGASATGGGTIDTLLIADNEGIGAAGALWIFKQDLATPVADNDAFAPVFADFAKLLTVITIPSYVTVNSMKVATLADINDSFKVDGGKLIGYLVPSGTPDWAASKSIYIRLGIRTQ